MRLAIMRKPARPAGGRDGAILVLALLTLAMITVMGVFSASRSAMELQIANNMENQVLAFFAAEAGISHGRRVLQNEFLKANQSTLAVQKKPTWNFILNGTYNGTKASTYWCGDFPIGTGNDCAHGASLFDGVWTLHGVDIVNRTWTQGNKTVQYTVTVWDDVDWQFTQAMNADGTYTGTDGTITVDPTADNAQCATKNSDSTCFWNYDPVVDQDGIIYVRSKGTVFIGGQELATAVHELTFEGQVTARTNVVPGLAQEFANEGHSSSGMDLNEISTGDLSVSRKI